jgi:hypothetical protein
MNQSPDLRVFRDGRVILRRGSHLYRSMRWMLCELAGSHCEECGRYTPMDSGEAHHVNGSGGGKRDDRLFVDGVRQLNWLCKDCHRGTHDGPKPVPAKPTREELKRILGMVDL